MVHEGYIYSFYLYHAFLNLFEIFLCCLQLHIEMTLSIFQQAEVY